MLFLLIMLGSIIWVSIWTILVCKYVFKKRFESIVRAERIYKLNRQGSNTLLSLLKLRKAILFCKAKTVLAPDKAL